MEKHRSDVRADSQSVTDRLSPDRSPAAQIRREPTRPYVCAEDAYDVYKAGLEQKEHFISMFESPSY